MLRSERQLAKSPPFTSCRPRRDLPFGFVGVLAATVVVTATSPAWTVVVLVSTGLLLFLPKMAVGRVVLVLACAGRSSSEVVEGDVVSDLDAFPSVLDPARACRAAGASVHALFRLTSPVAGGLIKNAVADR